MHVQHEQAMRVQQYKHVVEAPLSIDSAADLLIKVPRPLRFFIFVYLHVCRCLEVFPAVLGSFSNLGVFRSFAFVQTESDLWGGLHIRFTFLHCFKRGCVFRTFLLDISI